MIPPNKFALFDNFVPNLLPIVTPKKQIINVVMEIIRIATRTMIILYSAKVKPTDKASIEVAMPWTMIAQNPSFVSLDSSDTFKPSIIIFVPRNASKARAIQGINLLKDSK